MSIEKYQSGWKNRNFRVFSCETREAVRFATHPPSNDSRTDAMSILFERIGTPTARISTTGRPDEVERDVEVVDEEVEDDVHVEGARDEDAEAVRLDELHVRDERPDGRDGRVEALDVPDLQDAPLLPRERDETVRLGERRRDRLLDHDVGAAERAAPPRRPRA